jgi:hypothetical protein
VRYARDGDFVLVTNNASDFRQLYAAQPLHAGLIILIPAVNRMVQQRLFKCARGLPECPGQDQRRLHSLPRSLPLRRHLGPGAADHRRIRDRSLHVGYGLDADQRHVDLRAGRRIVSQYRSSVRHGRVRASEPGGLSPCLGSGPAAAFLDPLAEAAGIVLPDARFEA